jgi:GT2 family glycosyltransferase
VLEPSDELLVVDSASRDPSAIRRVAESHGARVLRCDQAGASHARNAGWRATQHEIVAFIDDDTRVLAGWADAVRASLSQAAPEGFITGAVDHPPATPPVERPVAIFNDEVSFAIVDDTVEPFGHGANHAVRREALEAIGGFDERLGAGGEFRAAEDLDLWDRLVQAGYSGRYVPLMATWHEQWRERRDNVTLDWSYGYGGGVRLAKLLRSDRARAMRSARVMLGRWGVSLVVRHLRLGHRYLAMLGVIRLCGWVVGVLRGVVIPIRDGHLRPRRHRRGGATAGPRAPALRCADGQPPPPPS